MIMGITPEQVESWPKSKAIADAFIVCVAVVYTMAEGVEAVLGCTKR